MSASDTPTQDDFDAFLDMPDRRSDGTEINAAPNAPDIAAALSGGPSGGANGTSDDIKIAGRNGGNQAGVPSRRQPSLDAFDAHFMGRRPGSEGVNPPPPPTAPVNAPTMDAVMPHTASMSASEAAVHLETAPASTTSAYPFQKSPNLPSGEHKGLNSTPTAAEASISDESSTSDEPSTSKSAEASQPLEASTPNAASSADAMAAEDVSGSDGQGESSMSDDATGEASQVAGDKAAGAGAASTSGSTSAVVSEPLWQWDDRSLEAAPGNHSHAATAAADERGLLNKEEHSAPGVSLEYSGSGYWKLPMQPVEDIEL